MTYSQHRANLKSICSNISSIKDAEIVQNESVNRKLEKMYSGDKAVLFRTFEEWQNMGYKVNKGEKAYKFWGTPQDFEIRNQKDPSKVKSIGTYCPIIFKFSENQVLSIQNLR